MNGILFFTATDGVNGTELWKSDGTAAGTIMLKDIAPGTASSDISSPINLGGKLFFVAFNSTYGHELWTSDGSAAGTTLVRDIDIGTGSSSPTFLVKMGGKLYFRAYDGVNSAELWVSDGTAAGTVMVKDIWPGSNGSWPANLTEVNGVIFFDANDGVHGSELWKSDGTAAGTVLVKDINPGTGRIWSTKYVNVDGTLFFSADDVVSGTGEELWKSDGTAAGTVMVKDINPGNAPSFIDHMLNAGGTLYFTAYDRFHGGMGLWKSDGTDAGTVMLMNIIPGSTTTAPFPLWYFTGTVYFVASDGLTGYELWKTDGTVEGTVQVIDLSPGASEALHSSFFNPTIVLPGESFAFQGSNGASGLELWRTDGTAAGTLLVHDIASGPRSSAPSELTVSGDHVFFSAMSQVNGRELWAVSKYAFANTPPPIVCPLGPTAEATSGAGAVVNYQPAVADSQYTTITYDLPPGSVFPLGATLVTATASNPSGQTASCSFSVKVQDTTPPVISVPGTQTFEATSPTGAAVDYTPATATDTASTPTLTHTPPPGSQFPLGSTSVSVVAVDAAGNRTSASFQVMVRDTTAPTLSCPADQTFEATSGAGAIVNFTLATATDAASRPDIHYSHAPGSQFPLGTTTVTVTAVDGAGHMAECTFQVIVRDTTAPVLSLPGDQIFEADSSAGAVVAYIPATATDAVSIPVLVHTPASGGQFPLGTTTVIVTATDAAGNSSTGSFTVTVSDRTPPTLTCPGGQVFEATSSAGAAVSYSPATAVDTVSTPSLTHSPPSGAAFPLGDTTVTAVAVDDAGNSASCTFTVTVVDTTPPAVTCPGDQTVEATSAEGALVNYPAAEASDSVSSASITYSQASGAQFGLGRTEVTATAADGAGNAASCSFAVTVQDTTPPSLTCPADVSATADTAAGTAVTYPEATATDAVSTPSVTYGQASGSTFPVGETVVEVTATDAASNRGTCTFTVSVSAPASGCGCQAPGGAAASSWAFAAALALLARRRRATRR